VAAAPQAANIIALVIRNLLVLRVVVVVVVPLDWRLSVAPPVL
jgi:hypothetical protein